MNVSDLEIIAIWRSRMTRDPNLVGLGYCSFLGGMNTLLQPTASKRHPTFINRATLLIDFDGRYVRPPHASIV